MCGIVGYCGPLNPKDVIIEGLKKLEYRGYDSAGVSILHNNHLKRIRASGKLKELETKLAREDFSGHLGIGHTRWATHGPPTERNAHPHQVGQVSLVHNGIIENYMEIREELIARGAAISSDTDSELVAHLISEDVEKTKDLFTSVKNILGRLKGAFSILVIWEGQPDTMVAFKEGPPLVIGLDKQQAFVASDVQALLNYTKRFIYLSDREIAVLKKDKVTVYTEQGKEIQKEVSELDWNPEMMEKQGFSHFMLKEIHEQPRSVASAMDAHIDMQNYSLKLHRVGFDGTPVEKLEGLNLENDWKLTEQEFKKIEKIFIVACGTSFYAGQIAKYLVEKIAKVPVEVDVASEFRYRNPVLQKNAMVLTISQSGETADTLAALRLAKEAGLRVLSLCNVKGSSIDREAHGHLYMNAGPEIGVASTKAFVATLTILNLVALAVGKSRGIVHRDMEKEHLSHLLALPSQLETVLAYDKYFYEAAEQLKSFKGFLYMGRGVNFPIAMEGALKLKELAYRHAEGYPAGEMKHGPLALIDESMAIIMVLPADDLYDKSLSNLEEARARGGYVISIGTAENTKLQSVSKRYLALPKAHWTTNPILAVVPLQLMSFHLADSLGFDVDQPRNLAKSVTVE